MTVTLITGGARSGKSRFAERRALELSASPIYLATAEALDAEMAARIAEHQARRGPQWRARAEPLELVAALDETDSEHGAVRLVDCLTLWLTNLFMAERDWRLETESLAVALKRQRAPVLLVTNEVGLGIVPENALARAWRDAAGWMNQRVAEAADEAVFVVAGLPMRLK